MTIKGLYKKTRGFSIENTAQTVFANLTEEFTEENKKQLFEGFNKFGTRLKEYANAEYAFYKYNKNPIPGLGNPDLFETGSFQNKIKMSIVGLQIVESSSDSKNDDLTVKYPGVFGLGGKYKVEFISKDLRPALITEARKRIFG